MLRDIREFIEERGVLSMQDLSIHFKMDKSALEPLVDRLKKSGDLTTEDDSKCSGCTSRCAFAGESMIIITSTKQGNCARKSTQLTC